MNARIQTRAFTREVNRLQENVNTLENIIGLPASGLTDPQALRQRQAELQRQAFARFDQSDPGIRTDPILFGDLS